MMWHGQYVRSAKGGLLQNGKYAPTPETCRKYPHGLCMHTCEQQQINIPCRRYTCLTAISIYSSMG